MDTNSPEFQSLLAAAVWWRDYATNLRAGRDVFPESPYPPLYSFTPYPPEGVVLGETGSTDTDAHEWQGAQLATRRGNKQLQSTEET